ncbi:DUF3293 domain-containing protein [Gluconacetobacter azotocaptans]|uniref:DUF3293 domain-containing protein n=1 Tax=Gluconacetobacter azotocaptans TaxID=142834 RepID=UPI001958F34F|nr:DUF3293 domain-containing protein [Gluconacetobacter azotocaptans]MBM9403128.1 DUF3293 domain-containing protein [Gluconacetobacter azotocaptans]
MTGLRPVDPATARAYRRSLYRAGGLAVQPGCRPGGRPGWWRGRRGDVVFVSACNPGGRRRPDGWNRRMMARLAEHLSGVPHCGGEGTLGAWSEALYAVAFPLARGRVVARRFRQNAVLALRDGQAARLVFLA